jgi:hypothetical protein
MPRVPEGVDDVGSDKAGTAGDQYSHSQRLRTAAARAPPDQRVIPSL